MIGNLATEIQEQETKIQKEVFELESKELEVEIKFQKDIGMIQQEITEVKRR